MTGPSNRRGFLRGLVTLPLIGGGVTLIGSPTAAAVPVTTHLMAEYANWLAFETYRAGGELYVREGRNWYEHHGPAFNWHEAMSKAEVARRPAFDHAGLSGQRLVPEARAAHTRRPRPANAPSAAARSEAIRAAMAAADAMRDRADQTGVAAELEQLRASIPIVEQITLYDPVGAPPRREKSHADMAKRLGVRFS